MRDVPPGALGALFERACAVTPADAASVIERTMADWRVAIVGDHASMTGEAWPASVAPPEVRAAPQ